MAGADDVACEAGVEDVADAARTCRALEWDCGSAAAPATCQGCALQRGARLAPAEEDAFAVVTRSAGWGSGSAENGRHRTRSSAPTFNHKRMHTHHHHHQKQ